MSVLGVRREGPLSAAFPCSLKGDSSESAEESVSEGGKEQEGGIRPLRARILHFIAV